jgi:hypothetical protein
MFYMSLKYIQSISFTTCFNHTEPSSGKHSFFKESIALHTMSLVLLSMSLFINLVLYGVTSSYLLYSGCSVHHWVCRLLVLCVLCWFYIPYWSLASHCGGPDSRPGSMWGLWWTKRHCGRFSPSTSVSPANHSTNFSIIIITRGWHNRSINGRSAKWTQLDSTPHYTN